MYSNRIKPYLTKEFMIYVLLFNVIYVGKGIS